MTPPDVLVDWSWLGTHTSEIGHLAIQHVQLTVIAVVIGLAISLPVGIAAYRHHRIYGPVSGFAGLLYTIPSLALFALLVPYTGLSTTTAEIGLVSYTLLILIRNIVSGLEGVPSDVREAARGMGYSDRQLLWRVEIPLALPVIIAGVRIATVTTSGPVTVTAQLGQGGLGALILQGYRQDFPTPAYAGAALSVVLAVLSDVVLLTIQRFLTPWAKPAEVRQSVETVVPAAMAGS
ncbi:MAG: osmoprotectant transport system permease protein [Actinomycetota bacterium]|nr:osmoprotectant transport system permease protein [Actinomycetota bacterium]